MYLPRFPFRAAFLACLSLALSCAVAAQADTPAPNVILTLPWPPATIGSPQPEIVQLHDYVFGKGGGQDLHAQIAYPKKSAKPLPAIIYIHGGGWFGGDNHQGNMPGIAQAGYFAASIEYRLDAVARWPAQIEDCKCAVRWLRANASKFNVDPNRIGIWGASAGGHLAACVGTMTDKAYEGDGGYPGVSSAVQAVCDCFGPTDLTRADIYSAAAIKYSEGLFGCTFQQNPALWKSGSPFYDVQAGDPPFLIVQGDSDKVVPMAQSTVFADALTKAGVPNRLLIVKNGDHGLEPVNGHAIDPGNSEILKVVADFFGKYLKKP